MAESNGGRYKWYIVVLCTLQTMGEGVSWISMPALFPAIAEDLHLNLAQLGALWGMFPLAGVFGLIGGLTADRLGVRTSVTLGVLGGALASVLRGLSDSFGMLAFAMFLFGLSQRLAMPGIPKTIRSWFGSKQLGLAMGISTSGRTLAGALGMMFAGTVLSSLLGGWRGVMFLFAGMLFLLGILWFLTVREAPEGVQVLASPNPGAEKRAALRVPVKQALFHVVRIRDVWLVALAMTGIIAANLPIIFYTPIYLEHIGLPKVEARMMASATLWGIMLSHLIWPTISDRLGRRKPVFMLCVLMASFLAFSIPALSHVAPLAGILTFGFFGGGAVTLTSTTMIEIRGVGHVYAGTASGLSGMLSGFGGFFSPIIGGALAEAHPARGYLFWGAMPIIGFLSFIFIRETGWRAKEGARRHT